MNIYEVKQDNVFIIGHANIQSLRPINHFNRVKEILKAGAFDIFCMGETWLDSRDKECAYEIEGYTLVRNDRMGKRGGGVGVYIKSNTSFKIIEKSTSTGTVVEYLMLEIFIRETSYLIVVVYRPPKANKFVSFIQDRYHLLYKNKAAIILGDINSNIETQSRSIIDLKNELKSYGLQLLPIKNTHVSNNCVTTIDVICTSDNIICSSGQFVEPCLSMHSLIYCAIPVRKDLNTTRCIKFRDYNVDLSYLNDRFMDVCIAEQSHNWITIDQNVTNVTKCIRNVWDEVSPVMVKSVKKGSAPWINAEILEKIKVRDKLQESIRIGGRRDIVKTRKLKRLKTGTKKLIKSSARRYINRMIDTSLHNAKLFWNRIKMINGNRSGGANYDLDPNKLAEHFVTSSVIQHDKVEEQVAGINGKLNNDSNGEIFKFSKVDEAQVRRMVLSLRGFAEGADKINIEMIKLLLPTLLSFITNICNISMRDAYFPSDWKVSIIRPIAKTNYPTEEKHFRPINILSALSKILEKIVCNQLMTFLETNKKLPRFQSAYRKMHSTLTSLLHLTEDIRSGLDNNEVVIMVLFDLSRAFERVVPEILLAKLKKLNLSDQVVEWFKSYLSGRRFIVKNSHGESDEMVNAVGVPQGAILGPVLFILYIYDIEEIGLKSKQHMYADDLQLRLRGSITDWQVNIENMNMDIQKVAKYFEDHGLILNTNKMQAIVISKDRRIYDHMLATNLKLYDVDIKWAHNVRNLGVVYEPDLDWAGQVADVLRKIYGSLRSLNRFRSYLSIEAKKRLVTSLLLPHLDPILVLITNIKGTLFDKLKVCLNDCVRFIYNVSRSKSVSDKMLALEWLDIRKRMVLQVLVYCHKIVYGNCPDYLKELLIQREHVRSEVRTSKLQLHQPVPKRFVGWKSFYCLGPRLWNKLPEDIKCIGNTKLFKTKAHRYLLNSNMGI